MTQLKHLSKDAIPEALNKADRYRMLNEAAQAESICLDILDADPENQDALVTLILAMTDQFGKEFAPTFKQTQALLTRLKDEYRRVYYAGVISERQGRAVLNSVTPGSHFMAYDWLKDAMELFIKADELHPTQNESARLRYNACLRVIQKYKLKAKGNEDDHHHFGE